METTNVMKSILTILISFGLAFSVFGQTRNVVVGTNGAIVQPTNFWSADASNARIGLGLGSAATNASSAFQPASSMLTNLASSNAFYLSNIQASNITGLLGLTNGGTGADNAINARANLGLGSASTNPASAFQPSSAVLSNLANSNGVDLTNITISNLTGVLTTNGNGAGLTNLTAANITGTVALASNVTGTIAISNGGTGATNVEAARTNLGLGSTNTVQFDSLSAKKWTIPIYSSGGVLVGSNTIAATSSVIEFTHFGTLGLSVAGDEAIFNGYITNGKGITVGTDAALGQSYGISFASNNTGGAAITRTNLGLGSSWLTNTNNPVFVNTNGEVVSPTNFWQVAPIQTLVQSIIPVTNSTNAATNARNLYVYSLATNVINVTNTITLPTNSSTFNGDAVTITHEGTTSSVTAIRQLGSATNFTTISNFAESVKFIRESDQWGFYHNISYVEPIRFTDGAIEENKAISRTNLGLGFSALTNTNAAGFQRAIFSTNSVPSNSANINTINFNTAVAWMEVSVITNGATNSYRIPLFQ